ncbi:hypothetical protein U9M48_029099 [Paspalum notatum var. saurae]|uniref:Integrase zinc-binding domain-containing protein n=1 Tax=Paspalum notatum var. saurae TaxID=547442 RepID=A0AAQ3U0Q3_PASNO
MAWSSSQDGSTSHRPLPWSRRSWSDGHEGVQRTLHRLRRDFHFPNMKQLVQDVVRTDTSPSTCIRLVSYSLSRCLRAFGLISPLTSWKRIPASVASLLY